jgi:hypothetical protein
VNELLCPCTFLALVALLGLPLWIGSVARVIEWAAQHGITLAWLTRLLDWTCEKLFRLWDAMDGIEW